MAMITLTQKIEAAPDRVFDVYTDLAAAADRLSGVLRIEILSDGEVGVGTRWKETRIMMGRECTEELVIGEFEPNRHYTVECFSCGSRIESRFDFEPDGDGTLMTFNMDSEAQSFFAKVMTVLMTPFMGKMTRSMQSCMETDFAELKAVAEAT